MFNKLNALATVKRFDHLVQSSVAGHLTSLLAHFSCLQGQTPMLNLKGLVLPSGPGILWAEI